jgi:hypothetical protein
MVLSHVGYSRKKLLRYTFVQLKMLKKNKEIIKKIRARQTEIYAFFLFPNIFDSFCALFFSLVFDVYVRW